MELGYNAEAEKILRAGLKEFPDSYKLMVDLMGRVWRLGKHSAESVEKEKMLQEVISLGETDKAIALAKQMPSLFLSAESLQIAAKCSVWFDTKYNLEDKYTCQNTLVGKLCN